MVKCKLVNVELEQLGLLFRRINAAQKRIEAAAKAQVEYAAVIDEVNAVQLVDSLRGEALCEQGLRLQELIWAGEVARLEKEKYKEQLLLHFKTAAGASELNHDTP